MIERAEMGNSGKPAPPAAAAAGGGAGEARTGVLRGDLEIFPGGDDETGRRSWVIHDPVAGSYFRIPEADYRVIRYLGGDLELGAFLEKLRSAGVAATRETVTRILVFLRQSGLLRLSYGLDARRVAMFRERKRAMFWHMVLATYLFFRIPLWSPDRFLVATLDPVRWIFNRWTLLLIKILAAAGYLGLVLNFYKFTEAFVETLNLQGAFRYLIAVGAIKVIHEFSHAYTARNFGCRVRKMGIAFVFFVPRLYTDLTDSWRIPDRRKRFWMDAAGIWSELLIGGVAALVWANTASGGVHSVAYYIFAVSIINTVLVNGNPFIRYDGYYLLMDLLNIDNLQRRSTSLVQNWWRRRLFGMPVPADPARGWRRILLYGYAVSAFLYRVVLYLSIVLLVYFMFAKALGIVLLILEVYLMILKPVISEIAYLIRNRKSMARRRAMWSLGGAGFLLLLLALPLPWLLRAPCETEPAVTATLYAPQAGFLSAELPADGTELVKGQPVFTLVNPMLELDLARDRLNLAIESENLEIARRTPELLGQIAVREELLRQSAAELSERERKLRRQTVCAPLAGKFARLDRYPVPDRFFERGAPLGEIRRDSPVRAAAYVSEEDVMYIEAGDRVLVALTGRLDIVRGKVARIQPMASAPAASPLLSTFGGPLTGVPDEKGVFRPLAAYFRVELEFPAGTELPTGRTGVAGFRKYSSILGNAARGVLQVLRRELSF